MGLSVGLVATAISSNIPTGVLVDCCFLASSAVFQLFEQTAMKTRSGSAYVDVFAVFR